jgi:hypothetical protein
MRNRISRFTSQKETEKFYFSWKKKKEFTWTSDLHIEDRGKYLPTVYSSQKGQKKEASH